MTTPKGLTRGARATFYRDGHELFSACDIPVAGAFATRELPPGQWVARDSCGGEQAFTVTVGEELTVILNGDTIGVTGGPGLSGAAVAPALRVGPGGGVFGSVDQVAAGEGITGPVRRVDGEAHAEVAAPVGKAETPRQRPRDPGSEVRVPGQAGAPLVHDDSPVPVVLGPGAVGPAPERSTLPPEGYGERPAEPTPVFDRSAA